MEKILLAINPERSSTSTIDFACYLAKLTHSRLTAVFLEQTAGTLVPELRSVFGGAYVETILESDILPGENRDSQWQRSVQAFENACANRGVNSSFHREEGVPLEELVAESRFADMLILDAEMSFLDQPEVIPTGFVKEVLAKSECPVVIAPYSFYEIDEIVFAYDGSASSVFAMKQFTYLLPELSDKKVMIVQVDDHDESQTIDNSKVRELLSMHYGSIGFELLRGKAADKLFGYLLKKKNVFVVMGAFGRNMLSAFFRHSTAELLIKTVNLPVFIAHH